ncbi:electron transport complex subunit RsxC [Aquitalea aquatilis]|uniref:electron transport complex subunit RsxC n=1 Tax=Aquitalea aquatilis TaxID=1537400 RepID=UPI0010BD16F7|nr:electron transport complex subunit RsxC [Aquitalea aquatilis]
MSRQTILPVYTAASSQPLATLPLPAQLNLWLQGSRCCVEVGQRVLKHQLLAQADNEFGVAVHAPTSGHIRAIGPQPQALPGAPRLDGLQLQPDGLDEALPLQADTSWPALSPLALAIRLQDMGVMGQHGPLLPLGWAAAAPPLALLIINAAENEPFLQADSMLLREQAAAVADAMTMLGRILQPARLVLAVQHEQGAAINALRSLAHNQTWQLEVIQAPYPAGDDAPLLRSLARPEESGNSLCLPVAGVYAAGRAILHGEPCISRIVTVSGTVSGTVKQPQNILALLGSPVADLLACAGLPTQRHAIVHGGGLRGFGLADTSIGIHQHSNCLLALPAQSELIAQPCIRCGDCASICPSQLQAQELYWHCSQQQLEQAQHWRLADCSQCGLCSAVCPSQLPLLDTFRQASQQLLAAEQQQTAADAARQRHRFRQFRLERDKQEKAQRLAERAAQQAAKLAQQAATAPSQNTTPTASNADKQAAIAAAMARAAQRQRPDTAPSVSNSERDAAIAANRQATIDAAMARAAARKAAQDAAKAAAAETSADNSEQPGLNQQQHALIQAAMQRANAQKSAAATNSPAAMDEDKKALIAAAMARAAAQKAARDAGEQEK